ncbi:MAG TPA: GNAT family N-acetyltransferase [Kofleriaceae bacterium]|nr:GNAT family N-acetyltransferase [Kofleriaceae bacterium]
MPNTPQDSPPSSPSSSSSSSSAAASSARSPVAEASDIVRVGVVGDFKPAVTAHRAIPEAIRLSAAALGLGAETVWLPTDELPAAPEAAVDRLAGFDAVWCAPASPYRHTAGALAAITAARTRDIPFFGSCGGFQHALLEIARSVLGIEGAAHAELDPSAANPVIAPLACSLVEVQGEIALAAGSLLARAYRAEQVQEGYHCSFGLNPAFESRLAAAGLSVTGRDAAGDARAFELDGPRFFTGTLFQPERRALAGEAPPAAVALLAAAAAARGDGIRLVNATTPADVAAVRALFGEYASSLGVDLDFQGFDAELADLPGAYSSPGGALFLVTVRGEPAACAAMRPLDVAGVSEMKRLYVRPGYRGLGMGRRLARATITAARAAGHRAMRLDTLPGMREAQTLYRELGFREIAAYRHNPVAGTRYLQLDL